MPHLPARFVGIIIAFAPLFVHRSWKHAQVLLIGAIDDTLVRGETVKLSSFGTFTLRNKGERVGRNPRTGVEVPIEQRRVMVFRPSKVLTAHMNGEFVEGED